MNSNECILLIADIHANKLALQAVIRDARDRYGHLKIWFLGDLFGRGPAPAETWEYFMGKHKPEAFVVGNHDWGIIGRQENVLVSKNPKIYDGLFNEYDWEVILEHRQQLANVYFLTLDNAGKPQSGKVLDAVQDWPVVSLPRPGIYLVHGGLEKPLKANAPLQKFLNDLVWGYGSRQPDHARYTLDAIHWLYKNWPDLPELQLLSDPLQAPLLVVVGHFHRRTLYFGPDASGWTDPVKIDHTYKLDRCEEHPILISPGGVGFPREKSEQDKAASYAVLCLRDQRPHSIQFHKIPFDRSATLERMRENGYPQKILNYLHVSEETEDEI